MSKLILGMPGVGKTFAEKELYGVEDLESSCYKWLGVEDTIESSKGDPTREPNPIYPQNYFEAIKAALDDYPIVLASLHQEVRRLLSLEDIEYWVCVPSLTCKNEYLQRYRDRENSDDFINFLNSKFEEYVTEWDGFPRKIELGSGQTLTDYLISCGIVIKYNSSRNKLHTADARQG